MFVHCSILSGLWERGVDSSADKSTENSAHSEPDGDEYVSHRHIIKSLLK